MNREVYVELLNNPAHLEMALSLARLGSWHWQASNNQLYFDANMAALIGIEGAHPRRLGEFFRFARPEQAEAFIQQWEGAVTRGTEIAFQGLVRRGDESVCHLEIIGRPQLGSDNEVVAIAGAAQFGMHPRPIRQWPLLAGHCLRRWEQLLFQLGVGQRTGPG